MSEPTIGTTAWTEEECEHAAYWYEFFLWVQQIAEEKMMVM
jgi:hypothetical protein